jgi:hypothetical protein
LNIQKKFVNFQTNQKLQPMNDKEMKLFEKIQAFKLDDNSTSLKFSERQWLDYNLYPKSN